MRNPLVLANRLRAADSGEILRSEVIEWPGGIFECAQFTTCVGEAMESLREKLHDPR